MPFAERCPHCGADERMCSREDPCVGRMSILVDRSLDLTKSVARCDHRPRDPSDPPPAMWCAWCGALKVEGTWHLPEAATMSREIATALPPLDRGRIQPIKVDDKPRGPLQ